MNELPAGKHRSGISVCISTRDRPDALSRCLDHLLSGSVLPEEILIVDQSQDDRTLKAVEQSRHTSVPLVYIHHDGSGLGRSQNIAMRQAGYPLIAVTDDDCAVSKDWLAVIEREFSRSESIDLLTGRVLPLGPDLPGLFQVSSRTSTVPQAFNARAMPWEIGSGNNFAVRREWLERAGGNDERLGPGSPGLGGVDMDLFYRLVRLGARARYDPNLVVYHERVALASRMGRRFPYGYGMGACCMLWLRGGDWNALKVLGRWILMRVERLAGALRHRQKMLAREEILVLYGTLLGLGYGLRAPEKTRYENQKGVDGGYIRAT